MNDNRRRQGQAVLVGQLGRRRTARRLRVLTFSASVCFVSLMPLQAFADNVGVGPDVTTEVSLQLSNLGFCYVGITGMPCASANQWAIVPVAAAVQTDTSGTIPASTLACGAQAFATSPLPSGPATATVPPGSLTLPNGTVVSEPGATEAVPTGPVGSVQAFTSAGGVCGVAPGWSGDPTPTVTVTVCDALWRQEGDSFTVYWETAWQSLPPCVSSSGTLAATAGFTLDTPTGLDPAGTIEVVGPPARQRTVYTTGLYAEEAWVSVAVDGVTVTATNDVPEAPCVNGPPIPPSSDIDSSACLYGSPVCGWCQGGVEGAPGPSSAPIAYNTALLMVASNGDVASFNVEGQSSGLLAVSGTGESDGVVAVSGTGSSNSSLLAVSATGNTYACGGPVTVAETVVANIGNIGGQSNGCAGWVFPGATRWLSVPPLP